MGENRETLDTVRVDTGAAERPAPAAIAAILLLGLIAALVTYKSSGALATIARTQATRTLSSRADTFPTAPHGVLVRPVLRTANYFAIVWPALVFGVLIAGAVRAVIPSAWAARVLGASTVRSHVIGGLVGAPLMLCSCCIAPVYAAVQERTRRAGPASALLLASPSLNPAALALTLMLFTTHIAVLRIVAALVLVFGVSALAARFLSAAKPSLESCAPDVSPAAPRASALSAFGREVLGVARTTLPLVVAGVILSSLVIEFLPLESLREGPFRVAVIALVALVSVPLALPTFAEIPLALGLLAAGAPAGAAVALLVAGPAVNLPSLLTVSRMTTPQHALALGGGTFLAAVTAGLLA